MNLDPARSVEAAMRQAWKTGRLDLSFTAVSELPETIGGLNSLQTLNLSDTNVSKLPGTIGRMSNLLTLNLSDTNVSELPDTIGDLTRLQNLNLSNTRVDKLPDSIGGLTSLRTLNVSGSPLCELPDTIGGLAHLEELDVSGTRLTELPDAIGDLPDLKLVLGNVRASLPPEIRAALAAGPRTLLAFLRARHESAATVSAAKLVFVGDGTVGKSSLLATLRGEQWQEHRAQTHGLEIKPVVLARADSEFTLYGWDFGGQHAYRPANQVFFSAPAIYLLLWHPRPGFAAAGLAQWLRIIRQRTGSGARVLLVATHAPDGLSPAQEPDRGNLQTQFGDMIVDFVSLDSADPSTVEPLSDRLAALAPQLPHARRRLPALWLAVQTAIEGAADAPPYLPYAEYERITTAHGVDTVSARSLALANHQLGRWVFYGDDTPELSDVVIFNPDWLSAAIAAVIDEPNLGAAGLVADAELDALWAKATDDRPSYPPEVRRLFARLMRRFELSYSVEVDDGVLRTLIGQLVPGNRPVELTDAWGGYLSESAQRTVVCQIVDRADDRPALPEGLIYRLIVRLHREAYCTAANPQGLHWNGGLLVEDHYHNRALVTVRPNEGVTIEVRGPAPLSYAAHLEEVITSCVRFWPGVRTRTMIPCGSDCPTPRRGLFDRQKLIQARERRHTEQQCQATGCDRFESIGALIHDDPAAQPALIAMADIEDRLDAIVMRDGERTREVVIAANQQLAGLIRSAAAKADEQFRQLRTLISDDGRDCPRLFLLEPLDRSVWHPDILTRTMRLSLCCEYSRLPLALLNNDPDSGVYKIDVPRSWWAKAAPVIRSGLKLVHAVTTMGVAGIDTGVLGFGGSDADAARRERFRGYADALEANQSVLELMPVVDDDSGEESSVGPVRSAPLRAKGTAHRWLKAELDRIDPHHRWGGLERRIDSDGHYVWVHPQFTNLYG